MKSTLKLIICLSLFVVFAVPAQNVYHRRAAFRVSNSPGTANLVEWWDMDEASGNRTGAHASKVLTDNATVGSAAGVNNNAADFETSNSEYLNRADDADLEIGTTDWSAHCFVTLESKTTTSFIFSKFNTTGSQIEYYLLYSSSADRFRFGVSQNGATVSVEVDADQLGSPTAGVTYSIYVYHDNGTEVGIIVDNGTADTAAHTTGVHTGTAGFYVGWRENGSGAYMDGLIDELSIWSDLLTTGADSELEFLQTNFYADL